MALWFFVATQVAKMGSGFILSCLKLKCEPRAKIWFCPTCRKLLKVTINLSFYIFRSVAVLYFTIAIL